MSDLRLLIVQRLPRHFRWLPELGGLKVEPFSCYSTAQAHRGPTDDHYLTGIKLLTHEGPAVHQIMQRLASSLQELQVGCLITDWQGEPCLFVDEQDESITFCRLKNMGLAVAEPLDLECIA